MEFVEEKCQERWRELLEAGETLALWDGAFVSRAKWLRGLGAKGGRPAWPSQAAARRGGRWRAKPRRQSTRECWVCSPETRIAVTSLSCACESVPGLPDQRRTNRLVPGNERLPRRSGGSQCEIQVPVLRAPGGFQQPRRSWACSSVAPVCVWHHTAVSCLCGTGQSSFCARPPPRLCSFYNDTAHVG